jgi:gliding motility-associated-like protein
MKTLIHTYRKGIVLAVMLVSFYSLTHAQNTLVLNGGITVLNGGTTGTPVYLVVNESNTNGITRLAGGGHIHSENQYNFVKWVSGTGTGNYIFPFGVGANTADYIPFTFNKTSATNSDVDMSTWQTNIPNMPHPAATNVAAVTSMTGTADSVVSAIDRFWDIQTSNATTADLTFSYLGAENTTAAPTDTVKAQHWNGAAWDPQVGPGNLGVIAGVGTAGPFLNQNTFSPWVLTTISPCPPVTTQVNDSICQGDSILLGGSMQNSAGVYYDTLQTIALCDSIIETTLTVNSLPVITTSGDAIICLGSSVNINANGANSYTWDNGLGLGQNHNVSPATNTTYIVTGTDGNGCSDTSSLLVTIAPATTADAGPDQELCEGISTFALTGNAPLVAGETGTWTIFSGSGIIDNPNQATSTGSGLTLGSTIFTWTITNAICPPSSDDITISVVSCVPSSLLIPNVFTPNGDNQNDMFTVDGVNLVSVQGEIYNRWGQKLFTWDNVKGMWDGRTTAGKECPDGTYFYIITALGEDGTEYFKKGTVSLIR